MNAHFQGKPEIIEQNTATTHLALYNGIIT